mmetsp:Transcript_86031/g.277861  ORF Transcript_86031/g.277861 Transcript_86031/m.277861 type:complete len:395 (-) Transcript_86031:200-1384(-)
MDTDSSDDETHEHQPAVRIPLGHRPVVFALPGSRELASKVLFYLGWQEGLCTFKLFGNGEISSKVEETVTNHDVFVLATRDDLDSEMNFSLMQLMLFIGALKGESPYRLTVVVPCLDYARQDRRSSAGEGIAATLMLRCLKTAGADRFLTVDLHNEAEVGFAPGNTVLDELSARRYLASFIRENVEGFDAETAFVCATSGGGMGMTRRMATELGIGFMMVDRIRPKAGGKGDLKIMSSEREDTIKSVIVVDDMFDTCGSLAEVCKALQLFAPRARLYAVASHGFFSGNAASVVRELVQSCSLQWIVVTNSVNLTGPRQRFREVGMEDRLRVVDVSRLLAGAMMRIYLGASVNLPKFRDIGPQDEDPMLQGLTSPKLALERRHTEGSQVPPPLAI